LDEFGPRIDLRFNSTLAWLRLPDVSSVVDQHFPVALQSLLLSLNLPAPFGFGVQKIIELTAFDHLSSPVKDEIIAIYVISFQIEELNWWKFDFDLTVLQEKVEQSDIYTILNEIKEKMAAITSPLNELEKNAIVNYRKNMFPRTAETTLREIWLYSSGNKAVLYYWTSEEGLVKLNNVRIHTRKYNICSIQANCMHV